MKKKIVVMVLLISVTFFCGCKKFVDVDGPAKMISSKNVFNNDATAAGAITSLYIKLCSDISSPGELTSLSCIAGLSADELRYYDAAGISTLEAYYQNDLMSQNVGFPDYWQNTYNRLYSVNIALEGLSASNTLSPKVKDQLIGEARFMRAFYYFYLVNLYGNVPLVLSSDYTINALIAKSTKDKIYEQIVIDLKEAQNLLSEKYLKGDALTIYPSGAEERLRPTKWAATALLARTYLYLEDWTNALKESTLILNNTDQFSLVSIEQTFVKNNRESIWQLQPTLNGYNTIDANVFVIPPEGLSYLNPVYLNDDLINEFSVDDRRKTNWIKNVNADGTTYSYSYKYKVLRSSVTGSPVTEYNTVMRIAEQYLIRAEARAKQDNFRGAIADIDEIRKRSGLALISDLNPTISKEDLLAEILKERRLELFTEWGHRWFDLKRTGKIDEIMSIATPKKVNGLKWKSNQQYYPISLNELNANPNLTQVSGY